MTFDVEVFKHLDTTITSKVKVGNGEYLNVKGKGTAAISTPSGIKLISDVLYVPEISRNLLNVGQMIKKGFSLHFEKMSCIIHDPTGAHLMTVAMKDKFFPIDWKQISMDAYDSSVDDSCLWHKDLVILATPL